MSFKNITGRPAITSPVVHVVVVDRWWWWLWRWLRWWCCCFVGCGAVVVVCSGGAAAAAVVRRWCVPGAGRGVADVGVAVAVAVAVCWWCSWQLSLLWRCKCCCWHRWCAVWCLTSPSLSHPLHMLSQIRHSSKHLEDAPTPRITNTPRVVQTLLTRCRRTEKLVSATPSSLCLRPVLFDAVNGFNPAWECVGRNKQTDSLATGLLALARERRHEREPDCSVGLEDDVLRILRLIFLKPRLAEEREERREVFTAPAPGCPCAASA